MDKVNSVSSQAVLYSKCPPWAWTHALCLPHNWSIASSKIDCSRPCQTSEEPSFQFVHTMDLSVVDTMLHDSPDLVIHRTEIWDVWGPQVVRDSEVSKRYHQNFLLCNNNVITACIADLFNSFCEELYAAAFFKVVQQQTIGEVGNSIMHLWADNFCLQQWKNY